MTLQQVRQFSQQTITALLRVDPNILAIVLFGSAVYAPKFAKDLDLLVVTMRKRRDDAYWDALGDLPVCADALIQQAGEPLDASVAAGVGAFGWLLWGDVNAVREVLPNMPVPTLKEIEQRLLDADELMRTAKQLPPERSPIWLYRDAFNVLFDAARMAAMAFLNTEETRGGELRRRLPPNFARRLRRIVNRLHVTYFYRGQLPQDVERAFRRWRATVRRFTNDLFR